MRCDFEQCNENHLGKFQSCLAEALWCASLDGFDETTGSTEAYGHYGLMIFDAREELPLEDGRHITVPAGSYIVESVESGAVNLIHFDTEAEAEARRVFAIHEADYDKWSEENEPS